MIKQKAPKNMTVDEFIDLVEKRYGTKEPTNTSIWINTLRMIAGEPAPNPFKPDQLAWMRIMQEMKFFYAVAGSDGSICLTEQKPVRDNNKNWLVSASYYTWFRKGIFLENYISFDDPEPLCFAEYAPLEEKK